MQLTWYGHSTFGLKIGSSKILIDPFLTDNPKWDDGLDEPAKGLTHIVLTHGHFDHVGDTLELAKKTGAAVHASFEITQWLGQKGLGEDQASPCNHGGTVEYGDFSVTAWNALHSSSVMDDGKPVYLGNPLSYVIEAPGEKTLYVTGDTGMFSDMALIHEFHQPKIGLICCGDRLTMGPKQAAFACKKFFKFDTVIPCHYGTFPFVTDDISHFRSEMEGAGTKFEVPPIGQAIEV